MNEPTNRELKIMLDNSIQKGDERHGEVMKVLTSIDDSLEKLEPRTSSLEFWRTAVVTAFGFLVGFLVFAVPYLIHFIQEEIKITVNQSLVSALAEYDIKVINPK